MRKRVRNIALFISAVVIWTSAAWYHGVDEFGRSLVTVLYASTALSLWRGVLVAAPLVAGVFVLVALSEIYRWRGFSIGIEFILDSIESVPSYLWVLAAVAAGSSFPVLASNVALVVGLAPLAYSTLKGVTQHVAAQAFIAGAVLSGLPRHVILIRHVAPHVFPAMASLTLNIVGAAVAVYGAIGAFGFANRQTLDLGTLLLRGRELAGLDASLLWLTVGAYVLLFVALHASARTIARSRFEPAFET